LSSSAATRTLPEFGQRGLVRVRHGKAMRGSAPKQRSVLTVFGWAVEYVDEWMVDGWTRIAAVGSTPLCPTERGARISNSALSARFRNVRYEAGIDDSVTFHLLRRSSHRLVLRFRYERAAPANVRGKARWVAQSNAVAQFGVLND